MNREDVKTAYMVLAHKNPEQVNMFLQQLLCDEQSDIYIHIDKKSMEQMRDKITNDPRIVILEECVSSSWGDISLVDATIILLRTVLRSGKKYDYITLRSGQDLMVKTGYREYLSDNRGHNFFDLAEIDMKSEEGAHFELIYPKCTRKLFDTLHPYRLLRAVLRKLYAMGINVFPNKAQFDRQIRLFAGSQWFCISLDLAEYMIGYLDTHTWYYQAFKDVYIPDTVFFNTLAMNSPFAGTIINRPLTYQCNRQIIKIKNHPLIFTSENIDEIEKADCFFARKFDINVDRKVMEYFVGKTVGIRPADNHKEQASLI